MAVAQPVLYRAQRCDGLDPVLPFDDISRRIIEALDWGLGARDDERLAGLGHG